MLSESFWNFPTCQLPGGVVLRLGVNRPCVHKVHFTQSRKGHQRLIRKLLVTSYCSAYRHCDCTKNPHSEGFQENARSMSRNRTRKHAEVYAKPTEGR